MQSISLRDIREGMKVYDATDKEIGTVEYVQFGDDDPATEEIEASGLSDLKVRDDSLIFDIAKVFNPDDDLPDEVRERLLHQGFVRIDADGWFSADRYVTPEQIQLVSGDALRLNVAKDQLAKRH